MKKYFNKKVFIKRLQMSHKKVLEKRPRKIETNNTFLKKTSEKVFKKNKPYVVKHCHASLISNHIQQLKVVFNGA